MLWRDIPTTRVWLAFTAYPDATSGVKRAEPLLPRQAVAGKDAASDVALPSA